MRWYERDPWCFALGLGLTLGIFMICMFVGAALYTVITGAPP